jgi:hypothetical protein
VRSLYLATGGGRTMRCDILPDDTVANGHLFVQHGSDGIRVDQKGTCTPKAAATRSDSNHFARREAAGPAVSTPTAEPRARICATNVAFGDADNRGLYISACTHLFKFRVNQPGVRPGRPIGAPPGGRAPLAKNLLKSGRNGLSNGVVWVKCP